MAPAVAAEGGEGPGRAATRTAKASAKRSVRKSRTGTEAIASLTTTKVEPHIAVVKTRPAVGRSAVRRVVL
ncbi:hypothetical protein ACFQ9X_14090 [Catenulispora yoronensis]